MISAGKFQEYPNGFGAPQPMRSATFFRRGAMMPKLTTHPITSTATAHEFVLRLVEIFGQLASRMRDK
jgi:hypothetical protein